MAEKIKTGTVSQSIRINRIYPDDLSSHFVSNVVVQHQPDCFIVSFFEIWPPAILGETEEEKQQELAALDHIDAKCVARLVLTPAQMKEVIEVFGDNWRRFEERQVSHK